MTHFSQFVKYIHCKSLKILFKKFDKFQRWTKRGFSPWNVGKAYLTGRSLSLQPPSLALYSYIWWTQFVTWHKRGSKNASSNPSSNRQARTIGGSCSGCGCSHGQPLSRQLEGQSVSRLFEFLKLWPLYPGNYMPWCGPRYYVLSIATKNTNNNSLVEEATDFLHAGNGLQS